MLLVLTPFLMCSSCDTSEVGSKVDEAKKSVALTITCDVTLPTSAQLESGYSWIDDITLDNTADLSNAYVYYANIDGTSDPVFAKDPFNASFTVPPEDLSSDKRSGKVIVGVLNKDLIGSSGKWFVVQLYNAKNKKTIATHEHYLKWDKPIKAGDVIKLDATLDGIYTNADMNLPTN